MKTESNRQHVIRRIFNLSQKRGRPVTFRDIYGTSARPRDELFDTLKELVEEGTVGMTDGDKGRGRPTTYFYLTKEWTTEPKNFFAGEAQPPLVQTERPNPNVTLDHRRTESSKLEDFMATDDYEEYFQVMGPRIWLYVHEHDVSRDKLYRHFLGPKPEMDKRRKFAAAYRRLSSAAYDEFYTHWWIRQDTIKSDTTGAKDRRFKTRLFTNPEPPVSDAPKATRMQHTQDSLLSDSDATRESMRFPDPSDDLPDMSRFESTVKAISA